VLSLGFFEKTTIGSGLSSLLNDSGKTMMSSELDSPGTSPIGSHTSNFTFDYPELLLEEEYVLPPPRQEQQADVQQQPELTTAAIQGSSSTPTSSPVVTTKTQPPAPETGTAFVIQVGSFRKFEEADRVKAELALNGHVAYIQKVSIEARGNFFRVRLGPFDQYRAVEQATSNLTALKYQPLVFRVKARG